MKTKLTRRELGLFLPPVFLVVAALILRAKPADTPFGRYVGEQGFSVELRPDGTCFVQDGYLPVKEFPYKLTYHATGFTAEISNYYRPSNVFDVISYTEREGSIFEGYIFPVRKIIATEHPVIPANASGIDVMFSMHNLTKAP